MFDENNWLSYAYLWQESPVWYWLAAGFALLALELMLDGSFFIFFPLGLGAIAVGLANLMEPTLSFEIDFIVLAVTSVSLAILSRWLLPKGKGLPVLNRLDDQVIGQESVLEEPISNGRGRVNVRGSLWTVRGPDMTTGAHVRIIGQDGNLLLVEPIEPPTVAAPAAPPPATDQTAVP